MSMSKPLQVLVDADMSAFQSCAAVEHETNWGNDIWTLHADLADAIDHFETKLSYALERALNTLAYNGGYTVRFCLSDRENYRKKLLPTYKANREGKRKPVCYRGLIDWLKDTYDVVQRPCLEADDCIGILATMQVNKGHSLILSGDKDMRCIPAYFYDYGREEFYQISESEANYWHLYQTLIGDTTDGYSGCPGVGPKTAQKLLADNPTWQTVVDQYTKKKLTEDDALTQARVARILRASDWDFARKEVKLWNP